MIGDQILHFFEFFYYLLRWFENRYFLMPTVVRKLKLHFWGPKRRFFEILLLPTWRCPGFSPGQNRIRLVLPFPKIQRTRESDTRSQSYRCLKFFLTVELWKFITNCTKTQINWNLGQFWGGVNALHAGKFSWFLKVFWYVNQRCKFGLKSTPSAVRVIFESRYLTICFEILYETSQSCSMKARMHVGKFS